MVTCPLYQLPNNDAVPGSNELFRNESLYFAKKERYIMRRLFYALFPLYSWYTPLGIGERWNCETHIEIHTCHRLLGSTADKLHWWKVERKNSELNSSTRNFVWKEFKREIQTNCIHFYLFLVYFTFLNESIYSSLDWSIQKLKAYRLLA